MPMVLIIMYAQVFVVEDNEKTSYCQSFFLWKIRSRYTEKICSQKHNQLRAVLGEDSHQNEQIPYHLVKNRKNVYITLIQMAIHRSFLLVYLTGKLNFLIFSLPSVLIPSLASQCIAVVQSAENDASHLQSFGAT